MAMEFAALEDQEANKNGKPALAKLRMLQDVMDVLQKYLSFVAPGVPFLTHAPFHQAISHAINYRPEFPGCGQNVA
jgi:hypothetical protein